MEIGDFAHGPSSRFVSTQFLVNRLHNRASWRKGQVRYQLSRSHHNSPECDKGSSGRAADVLIGQGLGAKLGGQAGRAQQPGDHPS